jgi:hypothetical protein
MHLAFKEIINPANAKDTKKLLFHSVYNTFQYAQDVSTSLALSVRTLKITLLMEIMLFEATAASAISEGLFKQIQHYM